jgi:hypothetical protein
MTLIIGSNGAYHWAPKGGTGFAIVSEQGTGIARRVSCAIIR